MKLIYKSAVVAEIEARYNECLKRAKIIDDAYWNGKADAYRDMLSVLDTIEVKEIDLEKEIDLRIGKLHTPLHYEELKDFAKHFFELGVKAQKEE